MIQTKVTIAAAIKEQNIKVGNVEGMKITHISCVIHLIAKSTSEEAFLELLYSLWILRRNLSPRGADACIIMRFIFLIVLAQPQFLKKTKAI